MPIKDPEARRKYQREWRAKRRAEWFADKSCAVCGSTEGLELDHIDPAQKVSHKIWSWSEARMREELAKCQPLCSDCHKAKTSTQRGFGQAPHGTTTHYRYGCRCDPCRMVESESRRKRRGR